MVSDFHLHPGHFGNYVDLTLWNLSLSRQLPAKFQGQDFVYFYFSEPFGLLCSVGSAGALAPSLLCSLWGQRQFPRPPCVTGGAGCLALWTERAALSRQVHVGALAQSWLVPLTEGGTYLGHLPPLGMGQEMLGQIVFTKISGKQLHTLIHL